MDTEHWTSVDISLADLMDGRRREHGPVVAYTEQGTEDYVLSIYGVEADCLAVWTAPSLSRGVARYT